MTEEAEKLTYESAGVDINKADEMKRGLKDTLATNESRVMNAVGAFSSLFDISDLDGIHSPVLCLKMEEPGSKQLLAAQHGKLHTVGRDLINHLINDTIMNGGRPLAILDTIVCGKLDPNIATALIKEMVDACKEEGCTLVGGETSEQPRVLGDDVSILSAACVGIVDRSKIITGETITAGNKVYAVASNGAHTNGYTLIRSLLDKSPELAKEDVNGESFIEAVLTPHLCYNTPLQQIFKTITLNGLAHITGGGVRDNLARVLPKNVSAEVDLSRIQIPELFCVIQKAGDVPHDDMLRTFNCGVGMIFVAPEEASLAAAEVFNKSGFKAYQIGQVIEGNQTVITKNELSLT